MKLAIIADINQKKELSGGLSGGEHQFEWYHDIPGTGTLSDADALLDLSFKNKTGRIETLNTFLPRTVIIHAVDVTLHEINRPFIRINAWPGFLKREIWEACAPDDETKSKGLLIFSAMNKKTEWVADTPGMVAARVIAMIINEAYLALEENISTREEIDIAMKTGTSYPYGPFEWAKIIGLKNIMSLLMKLAGTDKKYLPAALLVKESNQ